MFHKLIFGRLVYSTLLLSSLAVSAQTKLVIVGTVHNRTSNVTPDSIVALLEKIKPDIILLEFDSSFFNKQFRLRNKTISNESIAASAYASKHNSPLRPFDLEGRTKYYQRPGILQRQSEAYQKLISLRTTLDDSSKKVVAQYIWLTSLMEKGAEKTLHEINSPKFDEYAVMQQKLMNNQVRKIIETNKKMSTVKKTFIDECNFWEKRNRAMVANIKNFCELNRGKTIVVLTGFYHRHFLVEALSKDYMIERF
jgi:hypothetical protein